MTSNTIQVQSPGRINIIGEHTDYNNGFVLPAAINKYTVFTLQKNETGSTARFQANNVSEAFEFDLSAFSPISSGWQNYVMGVVREIQKLGKKIVGFDAQFTGNVPIGSGMSSSASLECSLAFGLNELFGLNLTSWELIKASQMAEHNFVGIKCGIMDQFASIMGKENQVMLLDCRSLEFSYYPFELGNHLLVLLNTNVSHQLANSAYNERRAQCDEAVLFFNKKNQKVTSLRDVTIDLLLQMADQMPEILFRRAKHVVFENARVLEAVAALQEQNLEKLGELMFQSHKSLELDYEVSCTELDYLVQLTADMPYVLGSRMMGGGFGGCTLNLIHSDKLDEFIDQTSVQYKNKFAIDLDAYTVKISNGTSLV